MGTAPSSSGGYPGGTSSSSRRRPVVEANSDTAGAAAGGGGSSSRRTRGQSGSTGRGQAASTASSSAAGGGGGAGAGGGLSTASSSFQSQPQHRIGAGRQQLSDHPGAYSVPGPGRVGGNPVHYTVVVPPSIRPGQDFQVMAGGVPMMVRCPENVRPGERIMVLVPRDPPQEQTQAQVYMATVPPGVREGEEFNVLVNGKTIAVTCPANVRPGMQIRIRLPEQTGSSGATNTMMHQTFEVTVPTGVRPGQPFALIANQQRVMVHCPQDARPGQKIRFQLPIQLSEQQLQTYNIHYNKDGWVRCVGADLKFHWVRHETDEATDGEGGGGGKLPPGADTSTTEGEESSSQQPHVKHLGSTFNVEGSAFVRKLTSHGPRRWVLEMVPAGDAVLEAAVPKASLTFQHLSKVSTQPFADKVRWFQQQCDVLRVPWDVSHQHIKVRRHNLLEDSMRAVETIPTDDMRQRFRFEFMGEPGVDAGGVAREWFQLVTEQLFNPDIALFQHSSINQTCMQINPSSGVANEEHLAFFHFAGRMLAKALFDGQIIPAHLVRPMYKHLMGWPIGFSDLEHIDNHTHDSLLKMVEMDDVEVCYLDFTVTEDKMGSNHVVELRKGGADISVTNANLFEYLELVLKHRIMGRIREQLTAFLVGFYDVIPEALLTVFDFQELELLMCGLPRIELEDWRVNTDYAGFFERQGLKHKVVKWFWEVLEEFETEQKARLLQFVTGTSGVPSQGFAVLQGNDGNIRRFTINGVSLSGGLFPRAHTCFNRIDLPLYASRSDLKQYLSLAIQLECTGFDID